MHKNKVIFPFALTIFISGMCLLASCSNNKNISSNNMGSNSSQNNSPKNSITESIGMNQSQIQYMEADREITISDQTDVSNIMSLLNGMKKAGKDNKIAEGEGIKGYFIQASLKKSFVISEQGAFFDGYYYEGITQSIAIKGILNKYTYDKKYIIEKIKNAKDTALFAKDSSISKKIKNEDDLIKAIQESDANYTDAPDILAADFPNYHIVVKVKENSYDLNILNSGNFTFTSSNSEIAAEKYKSNHKIWEYVSSLIPLTTEKNPDHVAYLFQSSKVNVMDGNNKGDYTDRLSVIVRTLLDGVIQSKEKTSPVGKRAVSLSFIVDKKDFDVIVYENGFLYNHKYYLKNGIGNELESLISAG